MAIIVEVKTTYKVNNFEFNNQKDAENFDNYLNIFDNRQLKELYDGYKKGINYKIYANPDFNAEQMELIREGLEDGLDVSFYAISVFNWSQMKEIYSGLEKKLNVSLYAKPEFDWRQMFEIHFGLEKGLDVFPSPTEVDKFLYRLTHFDMFCNPKFPSPREVNSVVYLYICFWSLQLYLISVPSRGG